MLTDNQKNQLSMMLLSGWFNSNPPGQAGMKLRTIPTPQTALAVRNMTDAEVLAQIVAYQTLAIQQATANLTIMNTNLMNMQNAQTVAQNNLTEAQTALAALG